MDCEICIDQMNFPTKFEGNPTIGCIDKNVHIPTTQQDYKSSGLSASGPTHIASMWQLVKQFWLSRTHKVPPSHIMNAEH